MYPSDDELGLSYQESVVLMLHDKPPQLLSKENHLFQREELQTVRLQQLKLINEAHQYCSTICK